MTTFSRALLSVVCLVLFSHVGQAQTLDEVEGPRLAKGRADVSARLSVYGVERTWQVLGFEDFSYSRQELVLFPAVSVGLGSNLQLSLAGTNQFGTTFLHPEFPPGSQTRETQTVRAVLATMSFRPTHTVQVEAGLFWGDAEDRQDWTYEGAFDQTMRTIQHSRRLSIAGLWLPRAGSDNRLLKADLDGLLGPLLGRGRWRVEGEAQWRATELRESEVWDPATHYFDVTTTSHDTRFRGAVSYGVTGRLQVSARAYRHTPFTATESTRSFDRAWDEAPRARTAQDRYRRADGVQAGLRGRLQRLEAAADMRWEGQEVGEGDGTDASTLPRYSTTSSSTSPRRGCRARLDGRWDERRLLDSTDRSSSEARCVWTRPSIPARTRRCRVLRLRRAVGVPRRHDGRERVDRGRCVVRGVSVRRPGARGVATTTSPQPAPSSSGASRRVRRCSPGPRSVRRFLNRFPMEVLGIGSLSAGYWTFEAENFRGLRDAQLGLRVLW